MKYLEYNTKINGYIGVFMFSISISISMDRKKTLLYWYDKYINMWGQGGTITMILFDK